MSRKKEESEKKTPGSKKAAARRKRARFFSRMSIFNRSPKSSGKSKRAGARKRLLFNRIRNLILLLIILAGVGTGGYLVIRSVFEIKTGTRETNEEGLITLKSEGDVVGIPGVPAYPESEFMYIEDINEDVVQEFLSQGQSAYVLGPTVEWENVVLFYEEKLTELGWAHLLSIGPRDENRKAGEYWEYIVYKVNEKGEETEKVDEDRSFGLRYYEKINGIWYEVLTREEARTGLSEEVARDNEIELLLSLGSMKELPKSFPWKLSYPEIWEAEIRESLLIEAPLAEFASVEGEGVVTVEPIAFDTGKTLKAVSESFLEEVNSRRAEGDVFDIDSTENVKVDKQIARRVVLDSSGGRGFLCVVIHPDNGIVYAVTAFGGEEAFFDYVLSNLEVR